MQKIQQLLAVGALALTFTPAVTTVAFAQSQSRSDIVAADHSMLSSKLVGMTIFDKHGQPIGTVADILVKPGKSEPVVVVSVDNGSGAKMVAVPLSHLDVKAEKASMKATKAELAALPTWQWVGMAGG